ncbi:MAG TPA: GrpB family protein [Acidimicrobiia bacterium]
MTAGADDPILARSREVLVGENDPVEIVAADYDPAWPERFERQRHRIERALGARAIAIEHVGSTSVPGLAAKPIIDVCLVVADSSDEAAYVPPLETAGYELRVREPDWHEHRMLRTPEHDVHVHVFSAGSSEIDRMLVFRDRLRSHPGDRDLYESTKRELAQRDWPTRQHYADAKTGVVAEIVHRATTTSRAVPGPSRTSEP